MSRHPELVVVTTIDWSRRAERVAAHSRNWATPDPWVARRAAVRTVDARMSWVFCGRGSIPAGWDCSDYLQLCELGVFL
jgi:hypothetical protein